MAQHRPNELVGRIPTGRTYGIAAESVRVAVESLDHLLKSKPGAV
jgi:hypothetical protein